MGLFSFVTDAGGKLGGAVYDMMHEDEDITKPVTFTPERLNELRTRGIESALEEEFGETVAEVQVVVNGGDVTLSGTLPDQETCEKVTLSSGNRNGISSVDCQIVVEKQEPEATFYTVKSGDTLGKIAKDFYQNAGKYMVIFEANKPMLTDPNKIQVGQTLRIPSIG